MQPLTLRIDDFAERYLKPTVITCVHARCQALEFDPEMTERVVGMVERGWPDDRDIVADLLYGDGACP